jgi:hypothetical protein
MAAAMAPSHQGGLMTRCRAGALVAVVVAAGCGEQALGPAVAPAPSFDIATERLVFEGPFSYQDRIGGLFRPLSVNDRGDVVGFVNEVGFGILPGDGGELQLLPPIVVGGLERIGALRALNQLGVAAGVVTDFAPGGALRARPLLWTPGSDPVIGPYLPAPTGGEAVVVEVTDVTDAGVVVGSFGESRSAADQRPYRWVSGAATAEILEAGAADYGAARSINSAGLAVGDLFGSALPVPADFNGAMWSAGGALTFLPGARVLRDVNEHGQIAGESGTSASWCPTLWDADFAILWQAPCGGGAALAVNDLGHFLYIDATEEDPSITGRLRVDGFQPATPPSWPGAARTDALTLNNQGTILGLVRSADLSVIDGVFWTYRIEPVPADELVEALVDAVDAAEAAGTLGSGNANALRAKLEAAGRHLAAGRCTPARQVLEAFVNQVDALERSGALSAAEAAELRDAANAAIAELAGTCGS